jgi:hypothetical protein
MLTYLYEKWNADLGSLDAKNGTALHWATYLGCELATSVLLTWMDKKLINIKDIDGLTPLHLGTIAGSTRIVRSMLLNGSDPTLKDKRGRTPTDIAIENHTTSMLELLKPPGQLSRLGCKPPLRPYTNYYLPLVSFSVVFSVGNILHMSFTLP